MNFPKSLLITFIALILMANTCHKSDTASKNDNPFGLPNATQIGADIFAFRMNGSNYVAQAGNYLKGGIQNDTLSATGAILTNNAIYGLGITINKNFVQGNTYNLNDTSIADITFVSDSACSGFTRSGVNLKAVSGIVTLTKLDTIKKIISGTFYCNIPVPNCDTLYITDGRFDIQYY